MHYLYLIYCIVFYILVLIQVCSLPRQTLLIPTVLYTIHTLEKMQRNNLETDKGYQGTTLVFDNVCVHFNPVVFKKYNLKSKL